MTLNLDDESIIKIIWIVIAAFFAIAIAVALIKAFVPYNFIRLSSAIATGALSTIGVVAVILSLRAQR